MGISRRLLRRLVAAPVALLLCLPVLAASAFGASAVATAAPAPYALIFGTLWGPGERPVYGVRMKLRRAGERKFRWEAISDHRGEFAFRVPAIKADYILVPDAKPPQGKPLPETSIHVEGDERVDIGVHLQE